MVVNLSMLVSRIMRKFLINTILFFGIILLVDFCIGRICDYFQEHPKGGFTKGLNDLVMNDSHDILIFGSSRAHHHYDTPFLSDTLGLDAYNAGYDGNGVILAYGLLDLILERYHPKLVLLDVEPSFDIYKYNYDDNNKRYLSLLKPYYRKDSVKSIFKDISIEEWYKVHSGLIRYNSKILSLVVSYLRNIETDDHGYKPLYEIYEDESDNNRTYNEEVDSVKLSYIEKFIKKTKEKKIALAVVASPKYGAESSDCLTPVIKLCSQYSIPFLDYYASPIYMIHKEWFRESMHLNVEGARHFSKSIASDIKRIIN